ncbi:flagellar biosynthetic protein FliO [Sodalis praecaptivus]|nr:flagellar biosynthetic protein FliO [Sodalis praecaptivus]
MIASPLRDSPPTTPGHASTMAGDGAAASAAQTRSAPTPAEQYALTGQDTAASTANGRPAPAERPALSGHDAAVPAATARSALTSQTHPAVPGSEFAAAPAPAFSASGALTQVGGALLGILLLIVIVGWLLKTLRLTPAGRGGNRLMVRASCSIGAREKVVIMQVEETWLVLGITPQHITTLHTLPAPAQPERGDSGPVPEDFRQRLVRQIRQRSGNA